jgi:hypothetical protein
MGIRADASDYANLPEGKSLFREKGVNFLSTGSNGNTIIIVT